MTMWKYISIRLAAPAVMLTLAACQSLPAPAPAPEYPLVLHTGPMPDFSDDMDSQSLAAAAARSLEYLAKINSATEFSFGNKKAGVGLMAASIRRLVEIFSYEPNPARRAAIIRNEFEVYKGTGQTDGGNALITGYYQPLLIVQSRPDSIFRYPIYRVPDDLVRVDLGLFSSKYAGARIAGMVQDGALVPYHDRQAIDGKGALAGKGWEIAWAENMFDVFSLHIQGSGILRFEDGTEKFANYAAANGREYRSIGRLMIDEGEVPRDQMSMQALRQWFARNPEQMERILYHNSSYVFFRLMDDGPFGSLGARLVGGRSAAFDHSLFPRAAIAWFSADIPQATDGKPAGARRTGRFVFNHDQGGAIKGPGRMDLFFGAGENAEAAAGVMKNPGDVYFLLLKDAPMRLAGSPSK
ncbi:MAG: MltA domain-containing protein [Nitrospinota bacterium]|nr:MltA domain-containing protein [Nitrospinota bacterium]